MLRPKIDKATIAAFRARVPMSDEAWRELEDRATERAFWVSGVADLDLITDVWLAIDQAIAKGTTLETFKAKVAERLTSAWGEEKPHRLDTIFRTNVQHAYGAGRSVQMSDPEIMEARPFWRFSATLDSRTTDVCSKLHGLVMRADHPFWRTRTPPLHFNCRSAIQNLRPTQAAELGIEFDPPKNATPAEGFGAAPTVEGKGWRPDLSEYPPELRKVFKRKA